MKLQVAQSAKPYQSSIADPETPEAIPNGRTRRGSYDANSMVAATASAKMSPKTRYKLYKNLAVPMAQASSINVYRDTLTGQLVLMKQLRMQSEVPLEVLITKKVNHINITKYRDFVVDANSSYLVTDYYRGHDMYYTMPKPREGRVLTPEFFRLLLISSLSALAYLEEVGIIHNDIKPANIMFTRPLDPRGLKLIDFGHASFIFAQDGDLRRKGTPEYMAPELFQDNLSMSGFKRSGAQDIWSLGMCCIEIFLQNDNKALEPLPDTIPRDERSVELCKFMLNRGRGYESQYRATIRHSTRSWSENDRSWVLRFMDGMLRRNPATRLTARQLLYDLVQGTNFIARLPHNDLEIFVSFAINARKAFQLSEFACLCRFWIISNFITDSHASYNLLRILDDEGVGRLHRGDLAYGKTAEWLSSNFIASGDVEWWNHRHVLDLTNSEPMSYLSFISKLFDSLDFTNTGVLGYMELALLSLEERKIMRYEYVDKLFDYIQHPTRNAEQLREPKTNPDTINRRDIASFVAHCNLDDRDRVLEKNPELCNDVETYTRLEFCRMIGATDLLQSPSK